MSTDLNRRRLIVAGAALAVAGGALAAEPRRRPLDFARQRLDDLVPRTAGAWIGAADPNVVPDQVDGAIQRGQTVTRLYRSDALAPVMLVASYHGPDSPDLKVHRPETCYTVAGFNCGPVRPTSVALAGAPSAPAVAFTAQREQRRETVLYWTRVGADFPQNLTDQRLSFFRQALGGVRADGLLLRVSTIGENPAASLKVLEQFAFELVRAAPPASRRLLIGQTIA